MNPLSEILRAELAETKVVSFARFMALALYHPQYGYYEQVSRPIGRRGDYYTSVSVGRLFGELLAWQLAQWSQELTGSSLIWIEAGAHEGQLAADMLSYLHHQQEELFQRLEYWIFEPSPRRQEWQRATLTEFAQKTRWFSSWQELPPTGMSGMIFSNEFLDSLPVHRLGWDAQAKTWFEWGVGCEGEQWAWRKMPIPEFPRSAAQDPPCSKNRTPACLGSQSLTGLLPVLPRELLEVLPDGFTTEVCPAADTWWRQAAQTLRQGRLLTIDYGFTAEEFYAPERARGTLRAYRHHRASADVLNSMGECDLTASVNFTILRNGGEAMGLTTDLLLSQERFLGRIAQASGQRSNGKDPGLLTMAGSCRP